MKKKVKNWSSFDFYYSFCFKLLPVYTGIVEKVKSVSLQVRGAVVGDHLHNLALGHASLQQSVIHGDSNAVLTAEGHVRRNLCFEGQVTHFMIGHQSIVHPLHHNTLVNHINAFWNLNLNFTCISRKLY